MGELYEFFSGKGCEIVGSVATAGYSFDDSRAVVDNKFVGLPIDVDNESDLTDERVSSWVQNIKPSFYPCGKDEYHQSNPIWHSV